MEPFFSFTQLANHGNQTATCVPDVPVLNASGDIQAVFKQFYEMLPANSPAKRRQLLNLLNQYRSLNSTEKAEFDKFLITQSGASR